MARACIAAGHEVAGHGYRWLDYKDAAPADEKAGIKECIAAITTTTGGVAPQGWFAGRGSPNSVGVIWEAFRELDLPLRWESDAFNDDVPYWVDVPLEEVRGAQGLLMLPYAYDTNDMKFVAPAAFGGSEWGELLRRTFDMLYEEGGKVMSVGIHPRLTGKPGRARALQGFLQYISEKEGVWVATGAEIAGHFRAQFPYPGKSSK